MRGEGMTRDGAGRIAAWIAVAMLAAALWIAFGAVEEWAGFTFARPALGALLAGAIELGLFALAFAIAPPLSRLVEAVIRAAVR